MKKILVALLVVLAMSCQEFNQTRTVDGWKVIEIDNCEYVYGFEGNHGFMAHKGNCINHE